jgi:hypothetical protein
MPRLSYNEIGAVEALVAAERDRLRALEEGPFHKTTVVTKDI